MTKTVSHINDLPYFGDDNLLEISQQKSFSSMIFELLSGKKPTDTQNKLFELILNISIDHGTDTPSAVATINSAKAGSSISESVASGITQINDIHGGAIEPAMELLYKIQKENLDIHNFIKDYISDGKRVPGFGHRIYEIDPRTQLIFKVARSLEIQSTYLDMAESIAKELNNIKGKPIPINIDGAIAVILCTFGWKSTLGKAVFISARVPGLCAQYINSKD